jgi:predicted dehydrogenase
MRDTDKTAKARMKKMYVERYGAWDKTIWFEQQFTFPRRGHYDLIIIATPPENHVPIALSVLKHDKPKILLIEKPLSTPSLTGVARLVDIAAREDTRVLVGYNHLLSTEVGAAVRFALRERPLGGLRVDWKESVDNILAAHPWLPDIYSSYLGYSVRGGGCMSEHSHAISLFLHMADQLAWGAVESVTATLVRADTYEREAALRIKHKSENFGWVVMDFVTNPPIKTLAIGSTVTRIGADHRPDDFIPEIEHIGMLLHDETLATPISLWHGATVMRIIRAAQISHDEGREVKFDEVQL